MARKSEIRAQARAGLDALLAAMSAGDEQKADTHIATAFARLSEAAGVSLREAAAALDGKGKKPKDTGDGEDTRLREAIAFASGESTTNPLRSGGLLEQVLGEDARFYLEP